MTKQRQRLIDRFQKWLGTNPSKNIIAAQCATIAEEYLKEQLSIGGVTSSTESKPERFTNPKNTNKDLEALPIANYNNQKYRYFIETTKKTLDGSCQCFKDCNCAEQKGNTVVENRIWYRHIELDGTDKCFYSRPYYKNSIAM